MSDGSQYLDIIIFAMIAVFLGLRLRSVLGRRTDDEAPPARAGFGGAGGAGPAETASEDTNVVDIGRRRRLPGPVEPSTGDQSLAGVIGRLHEADQTFTPEMFLQGARTAFEMIIGAFAQGDEATLRPLLADDVYENFLGAIRSRRSAGEQCDSSLQRIVTAELVEGRLDGPVARLVVRFVSQQIIAVRDAKGTVIEGDAEQAVQITDLWSFARDMRSPNPNWLLVATRSPDE